MNVSYRSPRVFVQFIGETLLTVSPEHVVSVRTGKSMGSPAGVFEILLKSGSSANASTYGHSSLTDYWLDAIRPMTLCVIGMGSVEDTTQTMALLENPDNAGRTPSEFLNSLAPEQQALVRRTIVMVGLVQNVNLRSAMRENGPERGLSITGKDFAQILMDDALRRIARSEDAGPDERRIVTAGTVPEEERSRLLSRASISQKNSYWKDITAEGADTKIDLPRAARNILTNAPSYSMTLANGVTLGDYFKSVDVSPELANMYVRATLSLFTYNGPVWEALTQQAPLPLAETFVDTVGLENRLIIRRPPFFRLRTMFHMATTMRQFLRHQNFTEAEVGTVMAAIEEELQQERFGGGETRVLGNQAGPHVIQDHEIVDSQLSRSIGNAISQYQVVPYVLTRGDPSGIASFQGATGAYFFDLPVALRYGSRLMTAVCPWDTQPGGNVQRIRGIPQNLSTMERALAATETVRLYYYLRDGVGFLEGTLAMRARPEIRIGDRVYLSDQDLIAYVESVSHTYQYGTAFVTQLTVSRAQPMFPTGRLLTHDTDPPALNLALPEREDRS